MQYKRGHTFPSPAAAVGAASPGTGTVQISEDWNFLTRFARGHLSEPKEVTAATGQGGKF